MLLTELETDALTPAQRQECEEQIAQRATELQLPMPMEPHPVWEVPPECLLKMYPLTEERRAEWEPWLRTMSETLVERDATIKAAQLDPLRQGVEADDYEHWAKADELLSEMKYLLVLGGWRSSKTTYGARTVMRMMMKIPGCRALCMSESFSASVEVQQRAMYNYLPPEYKQGKKNKGLNTSYSEKNGFSDAKFVLPGGRSCVFYNYTDGVRKVQGNSFHIAWCDENVTIEWLETMPGRLMDFQGKLLVTVTPIFGRTATLNWFLNGATVRMWQDAKYLAGKPGLGEFGGVPGKMPYVLDCPRKDTAVISFATEKNLFIPRSEIAGMAQGVSPTIVRLRLYGWPESQAVAQFPKFDVKVHGITADRVPRDVTRYNAFDPHGARNAFGLWMAVDRYNRRYVYRQFPTPDMGEWAIPGDKPDGKPGPAQFEGSGRGVNDYKRIILRLEGATWPRGMNHEPDLSACESIFERLGDARAINVNGVRSEGDEEVTFASLMNDELTTPDGSELLLPALTFMAATGHREGGREIDPDVEVINSWLDYDTTKPIEPLVNEPSLFVVTDACPDLIYALQTWTGKDGNKGATKDPIDVLRMFAKADVQYVG